jgi:hypothetical protein
MNFFKKIFIFGLIFSSALAFEQKWGGWSLRTISGFYLKWYPLVMDEETKEVDKPGMGVLAGWGIEYSIPLKNRLFLSFEAGFPYHSEIFTWNQVTAPPIFGRFLLPQFLFIFIPVTYSHVGFKVTENFVITLGLVYLWALTGSFRTMISDNVSFEVHWNWYIDRMLWRDGLHDGHLVCSFRYIWN